VRGVAQPLRRDERHSASARESGGAAACCATLSTKCRSSGLSSPRMHRCRLKPGMGFDVLSLVADAAARSGLSIEELKRITPMTLAAEGSDGSPSVGLQMILEEGGTASGAVTGGYMMTLSVAQLRMPSSD
jgi:hypothetical protein